MGWASAGNYFEPVAQALIDNGASDDVIFHSCKALISALQEGDWDTAEESLGLFQEHDAVVRAFRECGVYVSCGEDTVDAQGHYLYCEEERGHEGKHKDYNGKTF